MAELTDLDGVGPTRSDRLVEAGYDSVEAVAEADPDELAEAADVTNDTAVGFVVEAENLVAAQEATVEERPSVTEEIAEATEEVEEEGEEVQDDESGDPAEGLLTMEEEAALEEEEAEDEGPVTLELEFTFETGLQFDTFHDAMMAHRKTMIRGNRSDYEVFTDVLDAMRAQGPDSIEVEVEDRLLNEIHNAARKLITEYQGQNLIDHMDALKAVMVQIDEHRDEHLF